MKRILLKWICWAVACAGTATAAPEDTVWQWSVPVGKSRAYLWIPENCGRVRAVLLAQHNMIEKGILQHAEMRRTLSDLGMAEVFVVPSLDPVFQFDQGAAEKYDGILRALAEGLGAWWPGLRLTIDVDQISALHADRAELWAAVSAAEFLSTDEKRAMLGFGPRMPQAVRETHEKFLAWMA